MSKREDYEHLERDLDGNYYWFTNRDVGTSRQQFEEISALRKWFRDEENKYKEKSLYYKGTRLYFTYKGVKDYLHWVFYGDKLIKDAIKRLQELGAENIQINYGELD